MFAKCTIAGAMAAVLVLSLNTPAHGDQPRLGFKGTMVELSGEYEPLWGVRVDSVQRRTPAARMGLERGDIIVFIGGTMAFTNLEAYLYALRQQGQETSIGTIDVRTGRLVLAKCYLGHDPEPHASEPAPDGVIMVDFARVGDDA